jgi:hypothetical protein
MNPGDLMMLGGHAVLRNDASRLDEPPNFGNIGDPVIIISGADGHDYVSVIHPVHGIQDVFRYNLFPMTGNCESR